MCIKLMQGHQTVAQIEQDATNAAVKFASNSEELFRLISEFNSDDIPHILLAIEPENLSPESRNLIRAQIPTNYLNGIFALAVGLTPSSNLYFSVKSPPPLDQRQCRLEF